ncbi:MAG: outer membrane beta-barrel protein [Bacteroidales bacterium]|nr:outer membrane beta-barrel protein [Bacteroidales bacterium]
MKTIILTIILFFIVFSNSLNAQIIDNYGISIGAGLSNCSWIYKNEILSEFSGWKKDKISFSGNIFLEKQFNNFFIFSTKIGYFQNGCIDNINLTFYNGEDVKIISDKIILNNLNFDFSVKLTNFQKDYYPFLFLGLSSNYLLSYKSCIIEYQGSQYILDTDIYNDFKKITFNGIIGIGFSFKNICFIEFEYKPALSKNFNTDVLSIKSRYYGFAINYNIATIFNKNE